MKKIGFIDYYISEWHANNYPAWIKKASDELGDDFVVSYCYAELEKSLVDGLTTEEWAKKYGVVVCKTIEELCEKSDFILILAPSNPDKHLAYAEKALKYHKPTYIDKTFAPNLEIASKIFEIAKKEGTPFFSTSALRCADEINGLLNKKIDTITILGSGASVDEYIIHVVEMLVSIKNKQAKRLIGSKNGDQYLFKLEYEDGVCNILFDTSYGMPFVLIPSVDGKTQYININ